MADEIKIAEGVYAGKRGDYPVFKHNGVSQSINSNATQDDSAGFGTQTEVIEIYNTGAACYCTVWDTAGTVTAVNGFYVPAGIFMWRDVEPGQVISSKIV